ncbi:hypothetical protein [Nocardia sp. CA-119907]|uniref:hypothetical protein n=1 Tax=Nocardia sp. CA-119907 TaxID=3239973 RepID=UPI003D96D452
MHLDDREARTAFSWLDYAVTRRNLAREPIPPALASLRARLETAIRGAAPEDTTDMIGVRAASRILCCTERQVRNLAPALSGTLISGRWVFDREKVEEFARTPRRRRYRKFPCTE